MTNPQPTVPTRTLGTDWGTLTASCSHPHRVAFTAGRGATPVLTVNHVDYFCGIVVGRNEIPQDRQHRHLMLDGGWHVQHDDAWHALRRPGGGDATDAAREAFTATILPALRPWLDSDDAHVLLAEGDSYWRRQLADWAANTEADLVTAFKRLQAIAQQVARGETASAEDERFARYAPRPHPMTGATGQEGRPTMKVTIWHGTGAHTFHRRYEPGDPIERAYDYDIDHPAGTPETLAEQAFAMFNGQPATPRERRHTTRYYDAGNRVPLRRRCRRHR